MPTEIKRAQAQARRLADALIPFEHPFHAAAHYNERTGESMFRVTITAVSDGEEIVSLAVPTEAFAAATKALESWCEDARRRVIPGRSGR